MAKPQQNKRSRKINPARLKKLLIQHFDLVSERSSAEEVTIICPEQGCPDKTGNRSVNLKQGVTNCWRCNVSGNVINFLRRHGVEPDEEDIEEFVSSNIDNLEADFSDTAKLPVWQPIELPEGFTEIRQSPDSVYAKLMANMAKRKHLSIDDFAEAGVGFAANNREWEPFAIFPVYEMARLVYYQGRTFSLSDEKGRTKKFPSKREVPYGAGHWIYGYNEVTKTGVDIIIIVESILNVLSLRKILKKENIVNVVPIAVFKHKISDRQLPKILVSKAKEICIMYDGDATASAWKEAAALCGSRVATVAVMPVGTDANDDVELAMKRFEDRQVYTPTNALFSEL